MTLTVYYYILLVIPRHPHHAGSRRRLLLRGRNVESVIKTPSASERLHGGEPGHSPFLRYDSRSCPGRRGGLRHQGPGSCDQYRGYSAHRRGSRRDSRQTDRFRTIEIPAVRWRRTIHSRLSCDQGAARTGSSEEHGHRAVRGEKRKPGLGACERRSGQK